MNALTLNELMKNEHFIGMIKFIEIPFSCHSNTEIGFILFKWLNGIEISLLMNELTLNELMKN